jgi:hypothetical protein
MLGTWFRLTMRVNSALGDSALGDSALEPVLPALTQ